jgi:cytidylate kinase
MFERCRHYIDCRLTEGGKRRDRVRKIAPAVTISHETGSRAVTIGKVLAGVLDEVAPSADCHWTVFSKNLVEKVLEDHHLPNRLKAYMPEDRVGEFAASIEEILGLHPSTWTLFHHTVDTVLKLVSLGQVILVGRGTNLVAASMPGVLHVRLVGSVHARVAFVADNQGVSEAEARKRVRKADAATRRYVRQHFGVNNTDPLLYDLVIKTDRMRDEAVAGIIADALVERVRLARRA